MKILVLAEHDGNSLSEQTAKTVAAATALAEKAGSGQIEILVAGNSCQPVAQSAAQISNVAQVHLCQAEPLANQLAEPMAALILSISDDFDAILAPATSVAKSALPRVAAKLDVMQISEILEFVGEDTFVRPTYAGNALQTVQSSEPKLIATIRTTAFAAAAIGGSAPIAEIAMPDFTAKTRFVENQLSQDDRPDLTGAKTVVSGGLALKSKENFDQIIAPLADKLNAAIGASRAAVDEGYAPNDWQVGQTGKIVAPDLYIAVGISGAIQHLTGMKDSGTIIAINQDEEAPICKIADYYLVGDLFEIVPELTDAL